MAAHSDDPKAHMVIPLDMRPDAPYTEHEADELYIASAVHAYLRFRVSFTAHVSLWGAAATFSLLLAFVVARFLHLTPATAVLPTAWVALLGAALCLALLTAHAVAVEFEEQLAEE
jgi:hypothetical protein